MESGQAAASSRRAYATWALVATNVLLYLYTLWLGPHGEYFLDRWGIAPHRLGRVDQPHAMLTLLTAMFLHASAVHLLANMVYLAIFGQRVERALGSIRFIGLYLVGGLGATLALLATHPGQWLLAVGSSGAVAAVIGACIAIQPYLALAPLAPRAFRLGNQGVVVALLGIWLLAQLLASLAGLGSGTISMTGNSWGAHVGGFAAGLVLGRLLRPGQRNAPRPSGA